MEEMKALELITSTLEGRRPPRHESRLFEHTFLPRYTCWRAFFLSVGLHCLLVAIIVPLSAYMPESEREAWRRHARRYRPLEIHLPESMYVASARPEPKKPEIERKARKAAPPKPAPKPGEGSERAKASPLRVPPRRFELPPAPKRPDAEQTLLQAHLPPELALKEQVRLPQMMFWASHLTRLPKPAPKKFVEPGRKAPTVLSVDLDAPPKLDIPSQMTSSTRIMTALRANRQGLLHLPRPTTPIRVFQPPAPGSLKQGGSSFDILKGDPINVIALNANPSLPKDQVLIPAGNQIGALPPPPPGGETGAGPAVISMAAGGGSDPFGAASGRPGGAGTGTGEGSGAGGSGRGTGTGGFGVGSGTGVAGTGSGSRPGTGDAFGSGSGLGGLPLKYQTPIRIEHPNDAVFDIVVMQSSSQDAFPESAGVLSGRPVYTVYLQVGAPKAWIMQYCVPKEVDQGPRVAGGAVYLGSAAPLKAPSPRLTLLPPVTMLPRTSYIMVHGFLDKSGQFKDLTVLRAPEGEIAEMLLPQLRLWVFRPATRDGVPVMIEVLLAIPPQEV